MLMETRLCPACGSRWIYMETITSRRWYEDKYFVACAICNFRARSARTKEGAIRRWDKETNKGETR